MSDLIERLRTSWDVDRSIISQTENWMKERREAADALAAKDAEIAALKEALRPFVQCIERYEHLPGVIALFSDVTTERARKLNILPREVFYRARAALTGEKGNG